MSWLFGRATAPAPAPSSSPSPGAAPGRAAPHQTLTGEPTPESKDTSELDELEAGARAAELDSLRNDITARGASHYHMPSLKPQLVGKTDFIPAQVRVPLPCLSLSPPS